MTRIYSSGRLSDTRISFALLVFLCGELLQVLGGVVYERGEEHGTAGDLALLKSNFGLGGAPPIRSTMP